MARLVNFLWFQAKKESVTWKMWLKLTNGQGKFLIGGFCYEKYHRGIHVSATVFIFIIALLNIVVYILNTANLIEQRIWNWHVHLWLVHYTKQDSIDWIKMHNTWENNKTIQLPWQWVFSYSRRQCFFLTNSNSHIIEIHNIQNQM